jgi:periplasmic protein TonB
MRWPSVLALSLALNLVGWSLFGLWLGDGSLQARQPDLELSVIQLTPPPPEPRPTPVPPPIAEVRPPRHKIAPTPRPRPRAVARLTPRQPQPQIVPEPPPKVDQAPDPTGTVPIAPTEPVHSIAARHIVATPPKQRVAPTPPMARKGPDLGVLRSQIRRAVNRHRHYPRLARRRGIEGKVILAFRLSKAGAIQRVKVVHSAGRLLDKAALAALKRATPLPYYPDWVRLPVVFQLED